MKINIWFWYRLWPIDTGGDRGGGIGCDTCGHTDGDTSGDTGGDTGCDVIHNGLGVPLYGVLCVSVSPPGITKINDCNL